MIFDTSFSIAIKDNLGKYHIEDFTLFEVEKINEKLNHVKIKINKNREIIINLRCTLCEGNHRYVYNISDLNKTKLIVGGCKILGNPIMFIGKPYDVRHHIDKIEKRVTDACAML